MFYTFIDMPEDGWFDWEINFINDMHARASYMREYSNDDYAFETYQKLDKILWVRFYDDSYEGPCVIVDSIYDVILRERSYWYMRDIPTFWITNDNKTYLRPECRTFYYEIDKGYLFIPEHPPIQLIPSWLFEEIE